MFKNHRLRSRIAVAGAVLGAALGTAAIASAKTTTPAPKLPSLTNHSSFTGNGGLGPLLLALSQANGIKGTQFGEDLSTLAADFTNEDGVSYGNYIDGLNHLQAESASYPAPFNELFYNMAASLKKDAQP
jgi:hypothetical protein